MPKIRRRARMRLARDSRPPQRTSPSPAPVLEELDVLTRSWGEYTAREIRAFHEARS